MQVHIVQVDWEARKADLCQVRHQVFIVEQGIPEALEWDAEDARSEHFMALDSAGLVLGCARLTDAGQIGRMAVLAEQRGQGIGNRLLDAAVARGKEQQLGKLFLHAQAHAERFYRNAGFLVTGESFEEAGIPHIPMELALPLAFDPPQVAASAAPLVANSGSPGQPETANQALAPTSFSDERSALAALEECLSLPRRRLSLLSPTLDSALFDRPSIAEQLSLFARSGAGVQLRILIYSSKLMVARGHLLLDLARRLDAKIQIRRVTPEYAKDERSFLVWDQQGYWLLPNADDYQGLATGADPVMASRLQERFDYLWEKSQADPDLRTLKL